MATTKAPITPAYDITGYIVETLYLDTWLVSGRNPQTAQECLNEVRRDMAESGKPETHYRVTFATETVPAYPREEYIEQIQLAGYQGARKGESNPYDNEVCEVNHILWAEGAEHFAAGSKLFGA